MLMDLITVAFAMVSNVSRSTQRRCGVHVVATKVQV